MRQEIFGHYQKLSFAFFDNQKVGHLLSRVTSDLFDISELLHHGPENIVISCIKLIGAFVILLTINPKLALVPILIVAAMVVYAVFLNGKMKNAFKDNRRKIADINGQIEDSLSGIRVVKSFGNETEEMRKFEVGNSRFVQSKRKSYWYMGFYNSGMGAFSTLITVGSLIAGAFLMTEQQLSAADLVTFLLYINNFTEASLESMYAEILKHILSSGSRQEPYSVTTVYSYLYHKEHEVDRLIIALECVRYQVSPEEAMTHVACR